MQEQETKAKIQALIDDFKTNKSKYEKGSEADTETKLIEPLFEALGWSKSDFDKQPRAGREGKRGIADYAFKINDNIVFYLEAKKVGIILEKEADKQVISYAISKRPTIPFAVSTNFKEMNIFCVEQENALHQTFRSFKNPEDYLTDFSSLMWLSKENFEKGATLKKAEEEGRLKKRVAIDKILLEDMMRIRKLLVEDIEKNYSNKYELNEKEEIVQRIIDRLIFIRRCEDVGINPENKVLREITNLPHSEAYPKLKIYFKKYDEVYNSGLFAMGVDNDCDKIKVDGEIIKILIERLYEDKDSHYYYNFSWIDADVLGQVYEQYLGKILQQTRSGKAKLKKGQAHKKEQGIYYTPTNVVDFIIKNTIGEVLKDKKVKANNLKILDPACGSGSFLIKAFDYLYAELSTKEGAKQHKLDSQGAYSIKTEILKKNLFGVDLDTKAIEITKLNLLLKASEKFRKLPEEVDLHIKRGNSLIDNEEIDKYAFEWNRDFEEGSFDVVIGNPPYVSYYGSDAVKLSNKEREFFKERYHTVEKENERLNAFCLFLEKGLNLLKPEGYLGFIINKTLLVLPSYKNLRKYIIDNFKIILIVPELDPFDIVVDATIIILQKKKPSGKIKFFDHQKLEDNNITSEDISQESFLKNPNYELILKSKEFLAISKKIELNTIPLKTKFQTSRGMNIGGKSEYFLKNKKDDKQVHEYLLGSQNISQYNLTFDSKSDKSCFVLFDLDLEKQLKKKGATIALGKEERFNKPKLIVNEASSVLTATYDESNYYCSYSFHIINGNSKDDLKYLLGIINSKLMTYYFIKNEILRKGTKATPHLGTKGLDRMPIKIKSEEKSIVQLVDRILLLNKQLSAMHNKNTAETKEIKDKIANKGAEINQKVYKIYGLSGKEIDIVENFSL